jgi:hypothetical protein
VGHGQIEDVLDRDHLLRRADYWNPGACRVAARGRRQTALGLAAKYPTRRKVSNALETSAQRRQRRAANVQHN